jgi:hypothetical protein
LYLFGLLLLAGALFDAPGDEETLNLGHAALVQEAARALERFSNSREVSGNVQGGFFLGKKPLRGCAVADHIRLHRLFTFGFPSREE